MNPDEVVAMGAAIQADITLCLGLWKRACLQDIAQPYLGKLQLIDFDASVGSAVPPLVDHLARSAA